MASGSRVMQNAAALGRFFVELFGRCSVNESPVETPLVGAFRFTEVYVSE